MPPVELIPETFVADYTGEPGQRTFFVQARAQGRVLSYLLEKQQVSVLAEKLREVLVLVDPADPVVGKAAARDPSLRLEAPIDPEWRIGTIGISYDEAQDHVIVALQPVDESFEATAETAADLEPTGPEPDEFAVRLRLTREQIRDFVLHALHVVGEGRPTCPLCGLPMDPGGHACPASNGHRTSV